MKIKAKGLLRHRFWGDYQAHIILDFDSPEECKSALEPLNNNIIFGEYRSVNGGMIQSSGWRILEKEGVELKHASIEVNSNDLDLVVTRLVEFGADKSKITSMAKSIDYGERFEIETEVKNPNQIEMELK